MKAPKVVECGKSQPTKASKVNYAGTKKMATAKSTPAPKLQKH